ncbi:MAG TPA: Wzz/FepE/Etk N-terminal domain-containing protein [Thermoleophilia bacterium]|nr:Wzz/FepE/Etk N-terminal domain-containing protein [Thermoleophilia bacterium]
MMAQTAQTDDFDVDLSAWWHAITHLWWLVVLLVVVGAAGGYLIARHAQKTYSATSAVYLGQPTDANGNAIVGLTSNPRAAQQIVKGGDVLKQVSAALGGKPKSGRLGGALAVATPTQTAKGTQAPTNFVTLTVTLPSAEKAATAANLFAGILVKRLNTYSESKIALLEQEVKDTQAQLTATTARLLAAQKQLASAAKSGGASSTLSTAALLAVVQSASAERQTLQTQLQADKLSLLVAQNVEAPTIVSAASVPGSPNAPNYRLNVLAGGLVGLVVALVICAFATRSRRAQPASGEAAAA